MGQPGRPRSTNRILVEECCTVLSTALLSRAHCERIPLNSPSVTVTAMWPAQNESFYSVVRITRTTLPTGGHRVWYLCPACNRRCGRLYLFMEKDRQYSCRLCLNAAYHIQYRKGPRAALLRWLWRCADNKTKNRFTQSRQPEAMSAGECPAEIQTLFDKLG